MRSKRAFSPDNVNKNRKKSDDTSPNRSSGFSYTHQVTKEKRPFSPNPRLRQENFKVSKFIKFKNFEQEKSKTIISRDESENEEREEEK